VKIETLLTRVSLLALSTSFFLHSVVVALAASSLLTPSASLFLRSVVVPLVWSMLRLSLIEGISLWSASAAVRQALMLIQCVIVMVSC
jgi:hypothetical protein